MTSQVSDLLLSKAAFAARRGVGYTALMNWFARGKLSQSCVTKDGKIIVAEAERQLGNSLDLSRSVGQSLAANPDEPPAPGAAPVADGGPTIAELKLREARRRDQEQEEQALARRGVYVLAEAIRREHRRELSQFIATIEQRLPELVAQLGGGKEEIVLARRWWRSLRAAESTAAGERAEVLSEFVSGIETSSMMADLHAA